MARGAILLTIVAAVAGWFAYRHQTGRSALMRMELEREVARAEESSRIRTATSLKSMEAERGKLATVAISSEVLAGALREWVGLTFKEPQSGATITVQSITPQFTPGFPRVTAGLQAEWQGHAVRFEAEGVLKHELVEGGVKLQFVVLGVAASSLPPGLRSITSAELASWLNSLLPPFAAPFPGAFAFSPVKQAILDDWVPVPNGRIKVSFNVPDSPPLKVDWQPVAAFFDEAGLRVLARLSTSGPLPRAEEAAPAPNAPAPSAVATHELLAAWPGLAAGASYFARMPAQPLLDVLESLNRLPRAGRTIKVQSNGAEGHIMDRSGGLPFGNGFGAWLEHPDSVKVDAVLAAVRPEWRASVEGKPGGLSATGNIEANGQIQVHVHGNAPQVKKSIFGIKIIDVKVGGGAGTTIGATASAATDVTVALAYREKEQEFALQIESPSETRAQVNIGGVPDDLERFFKLGFKVPIPAGKDLYRFQLPPVIVQEIKVRMPDGFTPPEKTIKLSLDTPKVEFKADALEISGKVSLPSGGSPPATKQP
ncbi:MAG: hypothetical protein JWO82_1087 [Akkermansiaceae bacterium]|nr:hypothetical protein [Akkermansiaceae bacterium]